MKKKLCPECNGIKIMHVRYFCILWVSSVQIDCSMHVVYMYIKKNDIYNLLMFWILSLVWKMLLDPDPNHRMRPVTIKILERIGPRALASHIRTFADFLVYEFSTSAGGDHVNKVEIKFGQKKSFPIISGLADYFKITDASLRGINFNFLDTVWGILSWSYIHWRQFI